MKHVVIIGNGISGITAARHIRKHDRTARIIVVSSETEYFYSRTALMYIYMGHMKFEHTKPYEDWFWKKNRIELVQDVVVAVNTRDNFIELSGSTLSYDVLLIATGSKSNTFNWPGQELKGVQGLYSYADLQLMEQRTAEITRAVVVGGGLIGVEMAEMLHSRKIHVTFLVRENEFWGNVLPQQEARMISNHIRNHGIDLRLNTELKEITGDESGAVKSVTTTKGDSITCEFVGLTVGVSPNIGFLEGSGIETRRGVLVDEYLRTNITNVFAIGDCVERRYELPGRKNVEQVWYTGRMMGEVVAQTICGEETKYEPGPWFNSAKFFDIEYQTYGQVGNTLGENEAEFYWEHRDGLKCVHLVWEKKSNRFLGVNTFGIRMRHEKFDSWLRQGRSIHYVMDHLDETNFDPEFFARHEVEIRNSFNMKNEQIAAEV